jgi:hypothetical protein
MSELERKYLVSLEGIVNDLSTNNLFDTQIAASKLGKEVILSKDGDKCFIATNKAEYNGSVNNQGDVFLYIYNSSSRTWSYSQSFYGLAQSDLSGHNFGSGAYPMFFGESLCCNNDVTLLFVGIPGFNTSNTNHGGVCIFEYSNSSWSLKQIITNLDGNNSQILANNKMGASLACSNDGSRLFVGTDANYTNSFVHKYDLANGVYSKDTNFDIKPTLSYTAANGNFGTSIDCNSNGSRLFVASDNFAKQFNSSTYYSGSVHIYEESGGNWSLLKELFNDISNNPPYSGSVIANGSEIGKDISVSNDGSRLIVSTMLTGASSKTGVIYYFEYDNNSSNYVYKDNIISPRFNTIGKPFGHKLKMSYDGNYFITSTLNMNLDVFHYETNEAGTVFWKTNQLTTTSQDIFNDIKNDSNEYTNNGAFDDFGSSVAISGNGKFIAVGMETYKNDSSSTYTTGQVVILNSKIFQNITSFVDKLEPYGTEVTFNAQSNATSTSVTYTDPNTSNNIYNFKQGMSNVIIISGVGTAQIKGTFSGNDDFFETSKTIDITGRKTNQTIAYNAAIDTQGYIGIGQTSGITFSVTNETGSTSVLQPTMNINGSNVQYDPILSEFE